MKLPREIRENIIHIRLCKHTERGEMYPLRKKFDCECAGFESNIYGPPDTKINLTLARTSKAMHEEVMGHLYRERDVCFSCCCCMYAHLRDDKILRESVRSVKVCWVGEAADSAFTLLAKSPSLQKLTVLISKTTTANLTRRETVMRHYFPVQRGVRLSDALGTDELLSIRGLSNVEVAHIPLKQGLRRTEEDRVGLENLLRTKLLRPRSPA